MCLQDWQRAKYDAYDSNSDKEGAHEDEEDDTSLFLWAIKSFDYYNRLYL